MLDDDLVPPGVAHVAEPGAGLEAAISKLVRELCVLQAKGDAGSAKSMLGDLGRMSPPMEHVLSGLEGIPVDIRPVYPLAGETLTGEARPQ